MLEHNETRRRAQHEGYVFARNARSFARPFQARLSQWATQQARLRAVASLKVDGLDGGAVEELRREASLAREEFRTKLALEPQAVSEHSISRDMERAFERLISQLEELR